MSKLTFKLPAESPGQTAGSLIEYRGATYRVLHVRRLETPDSAYEELTVESVAEAS